MKSWAKYLILFGLLICAATSCQPTGQDKVTPISAPEVTIAIPSISNAEVFAKAKRDWDWNSALHRAIRATGERVVAGYAEDRVSFNGVDHIIDVMGCNGAQCDEFNVIIDDKCPEEIWVTAGPQKVEILVPSVNVPGTLIAADVETQKTAIAVLANWKK